MTKFKIIETKQKQKLQEIDVVGKAKEFAQSKTGKNIGKGLGILYRFAQAMGVDTRAVGMVKNIIGGDKSGAGAISANKFKEGLEIWESILANRTTMTSAQNEQFLKDIGWFKLSAMRNKFADTDPLIGYTLGTATNIPILTFKKNMQIIAYTYASFGTALSGNPMFLNGLKFYKDNLSRQQDGKGITDAENTTFLTKIGWPDIPVPPATSNDIDPLPRYKPDGQKTIGDFKQHWHSLAKGGMFN